MSDEAYICPNECKEGWLYEIEARNGNVGICRRKNGMVEFVLSRFKFGDNFTFPEIHWDCDEHFGTAKPVREIEKAPEVGDEASVLKYLNEWEEKLGHRMNNLPEWRKGRRMEFPKP